MICLILLVFTQSAHAISKPSMTAMWIEILFLIAMLIVLKIANFTNKVKFILFATYILSGIITQTLWLPIILFVGLYTFFNKNNDDTYS